jgi:hypothetical protein
MSLFLLSGIASAIQFTPDTNTKIGELTAKKVVAPVYSKGTLTIDETKVPMNLTGKGVRNKLEIIFPVDLYLMTSYISTDLTTIGPQKDKASVMEHIRRSPYKTIQMTIVYPLTADQIKTAFEEALSYNEVPTTAGPIKALLDQIRANTAKEDVITISSHPKTAALDSVTVDMLLHNDDNGAKLAAPRHIVLTAEGEKLSEEFWKVWFAKTDDDKMEALQDQLIDQIAKESK